MTAKPPDYPDALGAPTTDAFRALAASAGRPELSADSAASVILGAQGEIRFATPAAMRLFAAKDRADLQRAFGSGDGPGARRLRHLAAHLPVGGAPRLERLRFSRGPRAASVNLLCARVPDPSGGTVLVLWAPEAEKAEEFAESEGRSAVSAGPTPVVVAGPPPKSRFLWTLDSDGRFGATDPVLAAALGADAPRRGESIDELRARAAIDNAEALAAQVEKRQTFADLRLVWGAGRDGGAIRLALSAAPSFDRSRAFAGYRGFGTLTGLGDRAEATETPDSPAAPSEPSFPAAEAREAAESAPPPLVDSPDAPPAPQIPAEEEPSAPASEEAEASLAGDQRQPEAADEPRDSAVEEAPQAGPQPERTAEIFFLRQAAAALKVVPIRPGAADGLAPRDAPAAESVELSRSEREAFREIARALVGRAAPRDDEEAERATDDATEATPEAAIREPQEIAPSAEATERNATRLLDRLPVGVLVTRDARALYLNRTLLDLLGYPDLEAFTSSDALAMMFRGRDPQMMAVGDSRRLSIAKADGSGLAVEGAARVALWDGAPATLFSLRPSTEAERAGAAGRAHEERPAPAESASDLRDMLDLATDGAVILDAAGRIVSFNPAAERLFGYRQAEILGESVLMLLAPQSHPEATAGLDRLSRGEAAPEPERRLAVVGRNRDGGALTLELTLARIGAPEEFSYCALLRDAGREREAEARVAAARDAALAASVAKTDFLAQVSHEIRTPLSAILGFAEVMMEERFGPIGSERYRDYLRDIHTSGKHVVSLADDLLDLSKIESGKLELEFASVDANAVIRECVSLMQPQATRERVILRVSLFERLPRVTVDERSLKQVMLNLMSNAVKFTEPGGQVIVSTAVDAGGQAVIRVRDTGVGMSESEVGVALEPFGQIGSRGGKGGAGLGLPLTKALVEANNAEFSIRSRREQGTLIEIAFPAVHAAQ